MEHSPVVLIVTSEMVSALKAETDLLKDILLFAVTDRDRAFQAIMNSHPSFVVLQRDLLGTPRAKELIGQIRTDPDPTISDVQIRVIFDVNAYVQLVSRRRQGAPDATIAAPGDSLPAAYDSRQAARRFRTLAGVEVGIDGIAARLTDLSQTGAQLVAPIRLRPWQRVQILISDDQQVFRLEAKVVWASLEPSRDPGTPPDHRVGVTFIDVDREALEVFCARNQHGDRVEP